MAEIHSHLAAEVSVWYVKVSQKEWSCDLRSSLEIRVYGEIHSHSSQAIFKLSVDAFD